MKKHKRRNILFILLGVVALGVIGATMYHVQTRQHLNILRQDIQAAHVSLGAITQELAQQTDSSWQDTSECYRMTPRLFGEDNKYSCDVRYVSSQKPISLTEFDTIRELTRIGGRPVDLTDRSDVNGYLSYSSQLYIGESIGNCSLRYEYNESEAALDGTLACYYSLTKAEFDAISSVLPLGDDRT